MIQKRSRCFLADVSFEARHIDPEALFSGWLSFRFVGIV
jgi:hypothetical protein